MGGTRWLPKGRGVAGALLVVAAALVAAPPLGCSPSRSGSSFETIRLGAVSPLAGRVLLGWAREDRGDWVIREVEVDGAPLPGWNPTTERPVAFRAPPGELTIRLVVAREARAWGKAAQVGRVLRSPPTKLLLGDGDVHHCVAFVAGDPSLPRLRCRLLRAGASTASARTVPESQAKLLRERLDSLDQRFDEVLAATEKLVAAVDEARPPFPTLEVLETDGVEVLVDGKVVQPSAEARQEIGVGAHDIALSTGEGSPRGTTVLTTRGDHVVVAPITMPDPSRRHGYLTLSTTPRAMVKAGDEELGTTPLVRAKLAAGVHELTLLPEGNGPGERLFVTIQPGKAVRHFLALKSAPPVAACDEESAEPGAGYGYLTLQTNPWSIAFAGEQRLGQTPVIKAKLPVGEHRIRLLPDGREPAKYTTVRIERDQTVRRSINL